MKINFSQYFWLQIACLSLLPIPAGAQSSDLAQNLADCKNGRESCDRSRLSESGLAEVALSRHQRDVANCRNGYNSCDRSKLSESEAIALAVADHKQNVSNCAMGIRAPAILHG
jgi:hypothetical protein